MYPPQFNDMAFAFVNGIESAKTYQIPYGRSALLMDTDKPMFYVKSTNPTGQIVMTAYEFKEVRIATEQKAEFATKEQLDSLNSKIDQILKGMTKNEPDTDQDKQ